MLQRRDFLRLGIGSLLSAELLVRSGEAWAAGDGAQVQPLSINGAEQLAMRELRRYIYLRTARHPVVTGGDDTLNGVDDNSEVVVGYKQSPRVKKLAVLANLQDAVSALKPQEYLIQTIALGQKRIVLIVGGDGVGTLYGAYRFIETLGVRFYLHGDVLPDEKITWPVADVSETGRPLFSLRGIQPFHDFPEGPDWWNLDDYQAVIAQLPKLRMNFIGFHCYPAGAVGPEPAVWIGRPVDIAATGKVKFSYPAQWANTARKGMWGYAAMKTVEFSGGAALLFDQDIYGPRVMRGMMPNPVTPKQCNELFDRVGVMFRSAFGLARRLGVQTCVGTETPLTVPSLVQQHLRSTGINPANRKTVQELYKGIFARIVEACPTDFYWLWTPEVWTWNGNTPQQFAAVVDDIHAAIVGLGEAGNPVKFATCGWVLGPQGNRAALDKILPKNAAMSCINRDQGYAPVDPAFGQIHDRPKWAIPWLENDPHLTEPQPWVGRMRFDAADAHRYGCDGLLGIHWRTKGVAANVAALAAAGWDQSYIPVDYPPEKIDANRSMPTHDFYLDFCRAHFGPSVAEPLAEILSATDGVHMPTAVDWIDGPGGIAVNKMPWSQARRSWVFVEEMARIRPQIKSPGYLERFDDTINTFRYALELAHLGCLRGSLDVLMTGLTKTQNVRTNKIVLNKALSVRLQLARHWERMMGFALAALSTRGEMGTVANLEQHTRKRNRFLDVHDAALARALGHSLPAEVQPSLEYHGQPRLVVPTLRTAIRHNEALMLEIIILTRALSHRPTAVKGQLHWRPLGAGEFHSLALTHIARGVYCVTLPVMPASVDIFEYFVTADADGKALFFPATAPELNQTVVVT
ncbi:MAG: alpha-glucuronidase family glycosyl hydrolase [Phycisphaerae bacterium]